MNAEEIKRIMDDERAEQLTALLCRHWEVATVRLEGLTEELAADMDTCVEAEIYAAQMRMQRAVMALMELNKIPTAFLFSEYFFTVEFKDAESVSGLITRAEPFGVSFAQRRIARKFIVRQIGVPAENSPYIVKFLRLAAAYHFKIRDEFSYIHAFRQKFINIKGKGNFGNVPVIKTVTGDPLTACPFP